MPFSLIFCGLGAESVMPRIAVRLPVALGLNVTPIVHLPPTGSVDGQLFPSRKSPASGPARRYPWMPSGTLPGLVSLTVFGALLVPTG